MRRPSGRFERARARPAAVIDGLASTRPRHDPYPAERMCSHAGITALGLSDNPRAPSRELKPTLPAAPCDGRADFRACERSRHRTASGGNYRGDGIARSTRYWAHGRRREGPLCPSRSLLRPDRSSGGRSIRVAPPSVTALQRGAPNRGASTRARTFRLTTDRHSARSRAHQGRLAKGSQVVAPAAPLP